MLNEDYAHVEAYLLGELMMGDEIAHGKYVEQSGALEEDLFRQKKHKIIYRAIKAVLNEGEEPNIVSVAAMLDERKELESVGGRAYLAQIASAVVSSANIEFTTKRAVELYFKDRLVRLGDNLSKAAKNGSLSSELAEKMIGECQRIMERGAEDRTVTAKEAVAAVVEEYECEDVRRVVPTGIMSLDERLSGGLRTGLIVVAARPSVGKSNTAFNFMVNMTQQGYSVGLMSSEMDMISATQRSLACIGKFDDTKLQTKTLDENERRRFDVACEALVDRKFVINDKSAPTIQEVEVIAKKWKRVHKIDILIIDYLQHLRYGDQSKWVNREQQVANVTRDLKRISRTLDIPVVALAQLRRGDKKTVPTYDDLRESGQIEQEADVILLMHSFEAGGEMVIPDGFGEMSGQPSKDIVLFLIEKQRRGIRKVATFTRFDKITGRISSIDTKHNDNQSADTTGTPF